MCEWCAKRIPLGRELAGATKFCSVICAGKAKRYRQRLAGVDPVDWEKLCRRYDRCCAYCGKRPEQLTRDHVVPLGRGGKNTIGNLLPACIACNRSKGCRLLIEWRMMWFPPRGLGRVPTLSTYSATGQKAKVPQKSAGALMATSTAV